MPTVCSSVIKGHHVYYNIERSGRGAQLKVEVYKIATPPDVDPALVYAAFKIFAADVLRAEVSFPKLDNPVVVVDETPTEEIPNDPQIPTPDSI